MVSGLPKIDMLRRVGGTFTPAAAIDTEALFAGRRDQLRRAVAALGQKGKHVLLFGERGVGKTSLANIVEIVMQGSEPPCVTSSVNLSSDDTYSSAWHKVFAEIETEEVESAMTLTHERDVASQGTVDEQMPEQITALDVRKTLGTLAKQSPILIILDEFDRVQDKTVRAAFADTIKMLSDYAIDAKVMIVGVADTVEELLAEHQSIERALVQIHMQRMSEQELLEIIDKGMEALGMTIEPEARARIAHLSRGLPHYTHLLALHATTDAVEHGLTNVTNANVAKAVRMAIEDAHQTTKSAYENAVYSSHKESLYVQVLLACALAPCNSLGYFAPSDVSGPMSEIMGEEYKVDSFNQHLHSFCEKDRAQILQRSGVPRRYTFRFRNPVMQPFVILRGVDAGLIPGG